MTLTEKLPGMTDDQLTTLLGNAVRLGHAGTPAQRFAAEELMPQVRSEIATRLEARRLQDARPKPAAVKAKPAKRR